MKRILFVDLRNTARSQMAEAWFNQFAEGWGKAMSFGTMPAVMPDPTTIRVLKEAGYALSRPAGCGSMAGAGIDCAAAADAF